MSDRKYRQRGYQDEPRRESQPKPKAEPTPREFRTPNMPGFKQMCAARAVATPFRPRSAWTAAAIAAASISGRACSASRSNRAPGSSAASRSPRVCRRRTCGIPASFITRLSGSSARQDRPLPPARGKRSTICSNMTVTVECSPTRRTHFSAAEQLARLRVGPLYWPKTPTRPCSN